ncbi:MAG: DUF3617 family protein [Xylophilus ampelinus]
MPIFPSHPDASMRLGYRAAGAADRTPPAWPRAARRALGACALALLAGLPALAQEVRPGLWEMQPLPGDESSGRVDLGQAQQLLERLPAEQRRQIESRLARRGMAPGAAEGTVRICVTPEMATRINTEGPHGLCSTTRKELRSGPSVGTGEVDLAFRCTDPESSSSGRLQVHAPDRYTLDLTRLRPDGAGGQRSKRLHAEVRRVAAECGEVQPRDNLGF